MLNQNLKLIIPAFAGLLFLSSCSSSKKTATSATREELKGTWTLDNIAYEGLSSADNVTLTLLEEGRKECLTGSTWVLPNNGYGYYTIASAANGCAIGKKNIVWSYRMEGGNPVFQYKKLEGGAKADEIKQGFKFKILDATDSSLQLQSEVSFEEKPLHINYTFSKAAK